MLNPIPGMPQTGQAQDLTPKQQQKPKLDNTLTYHRWFLGMQCRKDILIENQVINKKIVKRVTPFRTRVQTQLKYNKKRLAYFVGFCVLFSMDKIYDLVITQNPFAKKIDHDVSSLTHSRTKIIKQQYQIAKKIKESAVEETKKKQLAELFMKLDNNISLNGNFMNKIGKKNVGSGEGQRYQKDYVDLGSFINYLKLENVEDVKSRIRGEQPSLGFLL